MQKKELGYVELEWTCPTCKVRNPGTATICRGCGTAQPAGVKFEAPSATELVTDQAKIERAKAGPDIQCGFCNARNRADAKVCVQCGADLTAGKQREAGAATQKIRPPTPSAKSAALLLQNRRRRRCRQFRWAVVPAIYFISG
jgi:ribosomal protein L40E